MSFSGKSVQEMGFDSVTNRFRNSLVCDDDNKPDFKELDLGSPVSPLRTPAAGAATSTSSSSSSSSVSGKINNVPKRSENCANAPSFGETSAAETIRSGAAMRSARPGHRRSVSAGAPLIYSGKSFASTTNGGNHNCHAAVSSACSNSNANLLPSGNICPSGRILKSGMACRSQNRTDTLGSGTGNYGHGSIVRGGAKLSGAANSGDPNLTSNIHTAAGAVIMKRAMASSEPEEVKKCANELYRRRQFAEALSLYDRAISLSPGNAAYRSNRGAALTALGRLDGAVRECEEAVRLDPSYGRAHHRLASLYLRLGHVEEARLHLCFQGQQPDQSELQKLNSLEKHLKRCADARKIGDWKSALRESDAAGAIGADSCPQLLALRAEAFLRLHQFEEAESSLLNAMKFEQFPSSSCSQTKFFGMVSEAYVHYVRAQVEMALGRFENAVAAAEKAGLIDCSNIQISKMLYNVKMAAKARTRGNELFSSGKFAEACSAYGEGLKYDNSNSILYCNRAVCWSKLGLWENSVDDCNQALKIQPNYTKALLRRAVSNEKLGRWAEAVRDYEVLKRELPGDKGVVEYLSRATAALKNCRGEEGRHMKFDGEVEEVLSLDKFKAATSSPGTSIVHFKATCDEICEELSPFINTLCVRYPSVKFFKVDIEESLAIAKAEGVRTVPTFKIYRNGKKVKEMTRPSLQLLEDWVRSCSI